MSFPCPWGRGVRTALRRRRRGLGCGNAGKRRSRTVALDLVDDLVILILFAAHGDCERKIVQFHRITRLKHIHRAADGGKIRPGDPNRVRVRIFQIQPRPDLPVLVFTLDDLEFQLEILPVSRPGGFHFRFGDDCLVFVAHVLKVVGSRNRCICIRQGGEEFALFCPFAQNIEAVKKIAQEIQDKLFQDRYPAPLETGNEYVTLSIGLSCELIEPDIPYETYLLHADKALYESKRNGRNQISVYGE